VRTYRSDLTGRKDPTVGVSGTGSAFPAPPFDCVVHSVFRSALNLRVSGFPHLCTLVSSLEKAHPLAAALAAGEAGDTVFSDWGLAPGNRGSCFGSVLSFAGTAAPAVRFPAAPAPSVGERMPPADAGSPAVRRRLAAAEAALESLQREAGAALRYAELSGREEPRGAFGRRFAAAARALAAGLSAAEGEGGLSGEGADGLLRPLIGFGEGLTPTGDDFVVGFLGALHARAAAGCGSPARLSLGGAVLRAASAAPEATNAISAAFLASAAGGRFSAALVSFAASVADPARPGSEIAASLRRLGSFGHSSGLDGASGFLFGFSAFGS
jgi:hypothetical protein